MDKENKKYLIKSLLSGKLTPKQRGDFADLESVDKEIKKQWDESGDSTIDITIKKHIWKKVKSRCEHRKSSKVHLELSTHDK